MWLAAKLHRLLQSRFAKAVRAAVHGGRPGKAQAAGMGNRQEIAGGPGTADRLSYAICYLLATPGQGPEDDGQQRLQRLALRRRLARQIKAAGKGRVCERGRTGGNDMTRNLCPAIGAGALVGA